MTTPDWTLISGVVDAVRAAEATQTLTPGAVARKDQVTAAMRRYLTKLGVDLTNTESLHAILACCVAIQYASGDAHAKGRLSNNKHLGAMWAASRVAEVVTMLLPDGVPS